MIKMETTITDKELDQFARRILPVVKDFFMDEDIKREFEQWKEKQTNR